MFDKKKSLLISLLMVSVTTFSSSVPTTIGSYVPPDFVKYPNIVKERYAKHSVYDYPEMVDLILKAQDLFSWWRFDLVAKYIYAKFYELGVKSNWARDLYAEHLRVWGGFHEWDNSKNSLDDFINTFHRILTSIKVNGFDPNITKVRIDTHGYPCEGSHRIAASLLYNKDIICYYDPSLKPSCQSTSMFFRSYENFVKGGLQEKYLDAMALQYCQLKCNTYVLLSHKKNLKDEKMRSLLRKYGHIVYEKDISLTGIGITNLKRQLAGKDLFNSGELKVYLIEDKAVQMHNAYSDLLGNLYSLSGVIYVSQSHKEALELSSIFFVSNSIDFMNKHNAKELKNFEYLFALYKKWVDERDIDNDCLCICGSTAKAVREGIDYDSLNFACYGLNELVRLDLQDNVTFYQSDDLRDCMDDIIFNPDNHFYYKNFKFSTKK